MILLAFMSNTKQQFQSFLCSSTNLCEKKTSAIDTAWKLSKYGDFLSVFSRIRTEYGEVRSISKCGKIRTRKNSVFGHISRSERSIAKACNFTKNWISVQVFSWENSEMFQKAFYQTAVSRCKIYQFIANVFVSLKWVTTFLPRTLQADESLNSFCKKFSLR